MLPIVINWPASDFTSLAPVQSFTENVPITFANSTFQMETPYTGQSFSGVPANTVNLPLVANNAATGIPNIELSSFVRGTLLPPGNVRTIIIELTNTMSFFGFTINGEDQYGNPLSETLNSFTGYLQSQNTYFKLLSIIPLSSATGGAKVSVGLGYFGETTLPMLDVYNKTSSYTVSYTNIQGTSGEGPAFEVLPFFVTAPLITWADRRQILTPLSYVSAGIPFNEANNNIIINSSTGIFSLPFTFTENDSFSLSITGIPLTSIGSYVDFDDTGSTPTSISFTQTIIQQGGHS